MERKEKISNQKRIFFFIILKYFREKPNFNNMYILIILSIKWTKNLIKIKYLNVKCFKRTNYCHFLFSF